MNRKEIVLRESRRFIKFGLVGVSNTVINYVLYLLLVILGWNYVLANTIGFIASVINAYYWNNRYVFCEEEGEKRVWWKTFLKSLVAYAGTGLLLNTLLLFIWIDIVGISKAVAPILNLLITTPVNFFVNKLWAYKKQIRGDEG